MNVILIIVLFFWNIFQLYNKTQNKDYLHVFFYLALLIFHFTAFFLFYKTSIEIERDSFLFYKNALNANSIWDFNFLGSEFMSILVYPFVKAGISYFNISFLFASISFIMFLKYSSYLLNIYSKNKSIILLVIILFFLTPSLHYWTAGLSKEAILFLFMGTFLFEVLKNKFLSLTSVVSLFFILLIRPYLFVIILFGFILHVLTNDKYSKQFKIKIISISAFCILIVLPVLKQFLKIESINLEVFNRNYESLVHFSSTNGKSSINLGDSNYLERLLLVLFRPFFYDAKPFFQYIISVENLIFLLLFFKVLKDLILKKIKICFKKDIFLLSVSIILILFYSIYMYNLGLASRMRVMYIPYFYVFVFFTYLRSIKLDEEKNN